MIGIRVKPSASLKILPWMMAGNTASGTSTRKPLGVVLSFLRKKSEGNGNEATSGTRGLPPGLLGKVASSFPLSEALSAGPASRAGWVSSEQLMQGTTSAIRVT